MATTVRALLQQAIYLAGVADPEFSPVEPDGSQINIANDFFVDILDAYRDQIPFWDEKTLDGESELVNVGASAINYVEYTIGTTLYELQQLNQSDFSRVASIEDLRAIPRYFWFDEGNQTIKVYPLPDQSGRQFKIGFLPLPVISSISQTLPSSIVSFMKIFLIYELASHLANFYKLPWGAPQEAKRKEQLALLNANSQNMPAEPQYVSLTSRNYPVPWLAYLSGNTPEGF